MRKIFIVATTLMLLLVSQAYSQFTVTFGNTANVKSGENTTVDVTVSGFENILGAQFSINFDSLVLGFVDGTNFTGSLAGLNSQAVSGPNGVGVKNGQITFSWFSGDGNGKTLPNGTRLFSIIFKAKGALCSSSDIIATNLPRTIEISNSNLQPVPFNSVKGSVKIECVTGGGDPCPDPVCSNINNLTFSGARITAAPGTEVCVPFTVTNFKNLQAGQGDFRWNPAELQYVKHNIPATGALGPNDFNFNATNTATGQLIFLWQNPNIPTPVTLPDGTKIIELCFKVLAAAPDTVCVRIGGGSQLNEWSGNGSTAVPFCIKNGQVNIGTPPAPEPVIKINDATGQKDQIVCVEITVEKFTNISALETRFLYNPAELELVRTDMYNLDGLSVDKFNSPSPGTLNLSWTSATGTTKPDGFKIFQICFKLLGPCPGSTNITFGPTEVSVLTGGAPAKVKNITIPGKITCGTQPPMPPVIECKQGAIVNVACNGVSNGSANIDITGTKLNECVIEWKNSPGGAIIKPSAAISLGTNITNLGAGTYIYTVRWSVDNRDLCSGMVTITQPNVLTVPTTNVVTNASCGNKGSINLSGTTGGTPPYTYNWNPTSLGNTANPTNLDPGQYLVTVIDANGCAPVTQSFPITTEIQELQLTVTTTADVKCNGGSDGVFNIVPSGGCMPFVTIISGGSATGLKAGTYTVTVTDKNGSSKTGSATITEPAPIVVADPIIVGSNIGQNNGSITLNISGGKANYTVAFTGGLAGGNSMGSITTNNVPAGTYTATITDANGCIVSRANIVVPIIPDTVVKPEIKSASGSTSFNGFGVKCFGDSNGSITVQIDGTLPMTAQLISNGQNVGTAQRISTGTSFEFKDVKAGTYTFTLTNDGGVTTSQSIVITQPTKLAATNTVTCTEDGKSTGVIVLNPGSTGVSPYTYSWSNSATTAELKELSRGVYNATITDKNGCTSTLSNIEIKNCEIVDPTCFVADKIITPNGDNFNDRFEITCVDKTPSDLVIYDRYGKLVYTQLDYDNTWSGLSRDGKDLEEGGYIWVLTNRQGLGNKEIYKGVITILR